MGCALFSQDVTEPWQKCRSGFGSLGKSVDDLFILNPADGFSYMQLIRIRADVNVHPVDINEYNNSESINMARKLSAVISKHFVEGNALD